MPKPLNYAERVEAWAYTFLGGLEMGIEFFNLHPDQYGVLHSLVQTTPRMQAKHWFQKYAKPLLRKDRATAPC